MPRGPGNMLQGASLVICTPWPGSQCNSWACHSSGVGVDLGVSCWSSPCPCADAPVHTRSQDGVLLLLLSPSPLPPCGSPRIQHFWGLRVFAVWLVCRRADEVKIRSTKSHRTPGCQSQTRARDSGQKWSPVDPPCRSLGVGAASSPPQELQKPGLGRAGRCRGHGSWEGLGGQGCGEQVAGGAGDLRQPKSNSLSLRCLWWEKGLSHFPERKPSS